MNNLTIIRNCWGALALVWLVGAAHTKPTLRTTDLKHRLASFATILLGFFLAVSDWAPAWLVMRPLPLNPAMQSAGAALTFLGCSFAIWARLVLGTNWSGPPTVKAEHRLVVTGPYAFARHPIYTGILVATLGTALADLEWRRGFGAVIIVVAMLLKIRQEERLMTETFPETYLPYRQRVKALIPGLF